MPSLLSQFVLIARKRAFCVAVFVTALFYNVAVFSLAGAEHLESEELITINMHNAELSVVIQWIGEQTGKIIVVDPRVKGKVTVLSNAPMTIDRAYSTFLALLDVYGFAASESGGILRIFPAAMATSSPAQLIHNFENSGGPQGQILYVFTAKNVSISKLAEIVKPLIPPRGYSKVFSQSNSLLIADEMENIKRLVELMTQLDVSGDLSIKVIGLNYASAKNVAALVSSLVKSDKALSIAISSDERSNSVLLSGDDSTKLKVEKLIAQLDRPISGGGNTDVVYLAFLEAEEVVPILRGLSNAMMDDSKNGTDSSVNIESSKSTNAIVMTAPPSILSAMRDVIEKIDIRRAQIHVEAIIVEVSQGFSQNLGIEWSTNFGQSAGAEAVTSFGLNSLASALAGTAILDSGLTFGFFRNGSLRTVANAIANTTDANILSTPSIVVLDNEEASVLVGSNIPLKTGQSTTTTTTTNPFTTIERKDIGLSLKITPHVNEGGSITLDILQEVETVSSSVQVVDDVVTEKRSIKTKVLVESSNILVLGGLISSDTQQLVSKVPILGDLPLVGGLFRSTSDTIVKTNLMVFIYPTIIESQDKANELSKKKYNLMKGLREKVSKGELHLDNKPTSDFIEFKPTDTSQ